MIAETSIRTQWVDDVVMASGGTVGKRRHFPGRGHGKVWNLQALVEKGSTSVASDCRGFVCTLLQRMLGHTQA